MVRTKAQTEEERAPVVPTKLTSHQGKELVKEGTNPIEGLEYTYPHQVDEVESEAWERMRMLLIGSSGAGPWYTREPFLEHLHYPTHYLDMRWLQGELEARKADTGANLEKALKELSAKENELGNWRQEIKVREQMIKGLKVSDAQKSSEIDRIKCELQESSKRERHLSKQVS
ncbi:uncharacterized protein A4U43_C08F21950 [Asparagus officinalis]|nr:uncharacterized protein A4U43_C08F21950 [Asparagus officinalis]